MSNQPLLLPREKLELKEAAIYINSLPPTEPWVHLRSCLPPNVALNTDNIWKWLGLTLHAFFGDYPNPLPQSGLAASLQKLVEEKHTEYTLLSLLTFQAEHFLQEEAIAQNRPIFWNKRSDIIKVLAYEDCRFGILLDLVSMNTDWISHSERSRYDRTTAINRYLLGELTEDEMAKLQKKWRSEDTKLLEHPLDAQKECPVTTFCYFIFGKYRKKLPAYEPWVKATTSDGQGQFAYINGEFKRYPGRGRNKRNQKFPAHPSS